MDLHGDFHIYDTTLRDGAQQEGLNLSVADKLSIARQLDDRRVQLALQDPRQVTACRSVDEPLHRRHELQRLGIEDPELLLHPDRERSPEPLLDHRARTGP